MLPWKPNCLQCQCWRQRSFNCAILFLFPLLLAICNWPHVSSEFPAVSAWAAEASSSSGGSISDKNESELEKSSRTMLHLPFPGIPHRSKILIFRHFMAKTAPNFLFIWQGRNDSVETRAWSAPKWFRHIFICLKETQYSQSVHTTLWLLWCYR